MRKIGFAIALFVILIALAPTGTIVHNAMASYHHSQSYDADTLSVVTYNIRGCRDDNGEADPEKVAATLRNLHADVIALQEVDNGLPRSYFVNQAAAIAARLHMNYAYAPSLDRFIGTFGNAVLSKYPIQQAQTIQLPSTKEPRTLLDVTLDWNGSPLHVYATHLGVKKSEHGEQIQSLRSYLQAHTGDSGILLGDFNMLPSDPLLSSLRRLYRDPLHESGRSLPTIREAGTPKEIDRIMLSDDLTYLDASSVRTGPSDHYPVRMEVERSL